MSPRPKYLIATCLLLAGCATPPAEYHDVVQHPFELHQTTTTLDLTGRNATDIAAAVGQFGAARPNNGSRFVVTADSADARKIQGALRASGVRTEDVRVVSAPQAVSVVRHDAVATVVGCGGGPRDILGFTTLDDGYGHDNANSALLGCAIRRNIAI